MQSLSFYIKNPSIVGVVILFKLNRLIPDSLYLRVLFRLTMKKRLDLKTPKTFNEKLQWLKLYDRNPRYTQMVDKFAVKNYVASKIGEEYIIPTLGVWDKPEDIDWQKLPNQFVLKTTHGSGGTSVVICKDKENFNKEKAIKCMRWSIKKSDTYAHYREWPYKNVPKRIIAEKYMSENTGGGDLTDYKFYCFDGEPVYCQVIRDRRSVETIDFYDMNWQHQEFVGLNPVARNGLTPVARPVHLENMKSICRKLSEGIPFARIDLYVINGKEYFGEITFYPASGIGVFTPAEWATKLGEMIKLPEKK